MRSLSIILFVVGLIFTSAASAKAGQLAVSSKTTVSKQSSAADMGDRGYKAKKKFKSRNKAKKVWY